MNDQRAPELISAGIETMVQGADRLGLTWDLRPATVFNSSEGNFVSAQYDGDSVPIDMVSMIGPLSKNLRVYAIKVPPAGNFIVGMITDPATAGLRQSSVVEGTDILAFTDVVYVSGSPVCGLAFIAPPSGIVTIFWHSRFETNTTVRVLVSINVATGSAIDAGTVVTGFGSSDAYALENTNVVTSRMQAGMVKTVTGLIPGDPYNVVTQHKVSAAGNGDIFERSITVIPSP